MLLSCLLQVCVSFHALMLLLCSGTPVFTRQQSSLVNPQGGRDKTAAPYEKMKTTLLKSYFTLMSYLLWHDVNTTDSNRAATGSDVS